MKELKVKHGFHYRIYPTEEQKQYFAKAFAANRWWWNYCIEKIENDHQTYKSKKDNGEDVSNYPFIKSKDLSRICTELKKTEECSWLNDCDASSLVNTCYGTLGDVFNAYNEFRKGKRGKPRFKKRGYGDSYTIQVLLNRQNVIDWSNNTVKIGKAGVVKAVLHKKFNGVIKAITVSKKSYDYYEISILFDDKFFVEEKVKDSIENTVGVDLGARDISNAILSDGYKFPTIDGKRYDRRMKRLQRRLKRKQEKIETGEMRFSKKLGKEVPVTRPSNNYIKLKDKIAKLHNKTKQIRTYNSHQITSAIANSDYGIVCIENLNVKGMTKNKRNARTICNSDMGEIRRQLEYKSIWSGQTLVKVDRFYPSTQTCSCCGYRNREIGSRTKWICPNCGTEHDRDINAAINIRNEGYRIYSEGKQKK